MVSLERRGVAISPSDCLKETELLALLAYSQKSDEADFKNTSVFSQLKILHLGAIQYFNFSREIHIVRYRRATLYFTIYSSSNVSVNLQS